MTLDQVVTWIVIGGVAGLIAEVFVRGSHVGLVGTIVVGMLGALLGGWLFKQLGLHIGTPLINDVVAAIAGSVILLFVLRAVRRR